MSHDIDLYRLLDAQSVFDLFFFQKHGQTFCSSSSVYCTTRYVIYALFDDPYVNFPFLFIWFEKVNFFYTYA